MTISPDTLVGTIDPELLPAGKEKVVRLPWFEADDFISLDQQRVVARHVLVSETPTTTWAEAIKNLRDKFRIRGAQRAFNLPSRIIEEGYAQSAEEALTVAQQDFCATMVAALTQTRPHYDVKIALAIKQDTPVNRSSLKSLFTRAMADNQRGALTRAVKMFEANYGKPSQSTPAGLGDPMLAGTSNGVVSDPSEPF